MKKYIIILFCLLTCGYTATAKIWRVNNNAGMYDGVNIFQTIQGAVNNAANKDTIHIEGSVAAYDASVTITNKKLYIFGPGFDLTANPETQHLKQSAKVKAFNFITGSNGSVLAGVEQTGTSDIITINADTIKIVNCRLYNIEIKNDKALQNIDIRKCWMNNGTIKSSGTSVVNNLNITNNFFGNVPATGNPTANFEVINLHVNIKALIANNTFYGGFKITFGTSPSNNDKINSGIRVTNNVFFSTTTVGLTNPASQDQYTRNVLNKVDNMGGIQTGVHNNTVPSQTAVLDWFSGSGGINTVDKYFTAKEGSPSPIRDAAPTTGDQLGMYGGMSPYVLSGMTNIPSVYEIVMPAEVSSDGFDVTVKVKAH